MLGSSPQRTQEQRKALGIERGYGSLEELAGDASVDVVHICTPNHLHFGEAEAALKAKKHVLCEKPLGMNSRETAALVDLARSEGRAGAVAHNLRYYPMCQEARALVRRGAIGEPRMVHGSYLQDWLLYPSDWNWRLEPAVSGSMRTVADVGTHWLDMITWITGKRVTELCADLATIVPVRERPRGPVETFQERKGTDFEEVRIETEDYASVLLRLEGGLRGVMTVSQVSAGRKNRLWFEIDGSEGSVAWDGEQPNMLWIGRRREPNRELIKDPALMSPGSARIRGVSCGPRRGLSRYVRAIVQGILRVRRAWGHECASSVSCLRSRSHRRRAVRGHCDERARAEMGNRSPRRLGPQHPHFLQRHNGCMLPAPGGLMVRAISSRAWFSVLILSLSAVLIASTGRRYAASARNGSDAARDYRRLAYRIENGQPRRIAEILYGRSWIQRGVQPRRSSRQNAADVFQGERPPVHRSFSRAERRETRPAYRISRSKPATRSNCARTWRAVEWKCPRSLTRCSTAIAVSKLKDPDGHTVEFVQLMPGSIHSRDFGKHLPDTRISQHIIHVGVTVRDRAAADKFYRDILGFQETWHGGMKDTETDWVDMRVPEGTDWLEYMLNVGDNPSPKTLGIDAPSGAGCAERERRVQDRAGAGSEDHREAADRARRQVAAESLRSKPDARGIDGAEAGEDAVLFAYQIEDNH